MILETEIQAINARLKAFEQRMDLFESQLQSAASLGKITQIRQLLEDQVRELKLITSTITQEIATIKTRLRIK